MGRIESADLKTDYERALVGMALIEGIQTLLWGKESNGAFLPGWHCFASLLAVKGSFSAPSGAPLTAAARCEPRPTMEGKGETATSPSLTNLALFRVHAVVRSKKYLTPPALLETRCFNNHTQSANKLWKVSHRR